MRATCDARRRSHRLGGADCAGLSAIASRARRYLLRASCCGACGHNHGSRGNAAAGIARIVLGVFKTALPLPHLQGPTVVSRPQNLHLLSHPELSLSPCRQTALFIGEDIPRTGPTLEGVVSSRTSIPVAEISYEVRRAGELARLLHRHDCVPDLGEDHGRASKGRRDVVRVASAIGDRFTDLLRPLLEQVRALAFPMRHNVLHSGFKGFLDTATSDEFVAEVGPALGHRLHGTCVCALDHCFHLVHVALKPELRGGLCREALVGRNVFQSSDALVCHG